jgi:hypothetical protein
MTLTARTRRASLTGAMLAVAAVLAAGCSPSTSSSSASGSSSSATGGASGATAASSAPASGSGSAASGSVASGSAASGSGASGSVVVASPAASGAASGTPACTTNDLKTTIGNYGGGTPGSYYSIIDFTNTSSASCTLYGYPGVSLRNAEYAQIGAAATRTAKPAPSLVTLAPGATGNASLRMTDPSVYPSSECDQVTSAYLMIYPPDQTESTELPLKEATCSSSSIKMLGIGAIAAGAAG